MNPIYYALIFTFLIVVPIVGIVWLCVRAKRESEEIIRQAHEMEKTVIAKGFPAGVYTKDDSALLPTVIASSMLSDGPSHSSAAQSSCALFSDSSSAAYRRASSCDRGSFGEGD